MGGPVPVPQLGTAGEGLEDLVSLLKIEAKFEVFN